MTKSLAVLSFVTGGIRIADTQEGGAAISFLVSDNQKEERHTLQFLYDAFWDLMTACTMVEFHRGEERKAYEELHARYLADKDATLKTLLAHDPYAVYQRRKESIVLHETATTEIMQGILVVNRVFELHQDGLRMILTTAKGKTFTLDIATAQVFRLQDILKSIADALGLEEPKVSEAN